MAGHNNERDEAILQLYEEGFNYQEIVDLLREHHDIVLSVRHLKRILKDNGLGRRKNDCSFAVLCNTVNMEINTSGSLLGYRTMHHKLKIVHGINVPRKIVSEVQTILDPIGVAHRRSRRLKRRLYYAKGPNYIWHLDGYDKLKRYGFCIHGCIDGYSRKLLWLETASSNNCPQTVARYFLEYVNNIEGTARVVRADRGTENVNIAAIQRFFRLNDNDSMAGQKSFLYGRSTANQRIEAFWSQLRRSFTQRWLNLFKDMSDDGSWDEDDPIHRECLKFCFTFTIQSELDEFKRLHNTHRIRQSTNLESPGGKPNILYHAPVLSGTIDYRFAVDERNREVSKVLTKRKQDFGCEEDFVRIAMYYIGHNNIDFPKTVDQARRLYDDLLNFVNTL